MIKGQTIVVLQEIQICYKEAYILLLTVRKTIGLTCNKNKVFQIGFFFNKMTSMAIICAFVVETISIESSKMWALRLPLYIHLFEQLSL